MHVMMFVSISFVDVLLNTKNKGLSGTGRDYN